MKTIIINEKAEKKLIETLINEEISNWGDKLEKVKKYIESNFIRATQDINDKYGASTSKYIALGIDTKKQPNGAKYEISDLFNKLQYRFQTILSDKKDRDELIRQAIKNWCNKK